MNKIILIIVLLVVSQMKSQVLQQENSAELPKSVKINKDTITSDFNIKKRNVMDLIRGKSPDIMLTYYRFYLKDKDNLRADTLMDELLKKENTADYRYRISLISYRYTSDTKTRILFLSDPGRLKEYRNYFMKYGISSLKSNADIRGHYYNLVALDSASYHMAPDSLLQKQTARHYNSLAWYSMLTNKLNDVEHYLNQSSIYDPESKYPYSNKPLLLLLQGHYKQARALYIKLKDEPFEVGNSTFKDEFLTDFKELAKAGVINRDIKKIKELLISNSKK